MASELMPKCQPAKNQPRNAEMTIRYRPACVSVLMGLEDCVDTVCSWLVAADNALRNTVVQQIGLAPCTWRETLPPPLVLTQPS